MSVSERLWSKIPTLDERVCWPFEGARNARGYGLLKVGGRSTLAHRMVWEDLHGPIPDGLCILHHCDNPPCCNPAHLFEGTRIDNNTDMRAKGRGSQPPRNDLRGERHPRAKLTRDAVLEIRRRCANGEGVSAVARHFGVSHSLVSMVVSGKKWAWL